MSEELTLLSPRERKVYDAIAEWKAQQRSADLDPDTVKLIKDGLLRVSMEIEMHDPE